MPKVKRLTMKQKNFADFLLKNPKSNPTQAALHAYDATYQSAKKMSSDLMDNPMIQAYLEVHAQEAQETVLDVMSTSREHSKSGKKEGAAYASVALNAAQDVLDRSYGKATQRIESTNKSVNINIDLS